MSVVCRTWCQGVTLCVCVTVLAVVAAPTGKRLPYTDTTLRYLMSFGYLPTSDLETGNLRSDDQLREAITNLQAFGNIPLTGVVDARTERLMASPRCGVSDEREPYNRKKRFAIHSGARWDHTDLTWSLRAHHIKLDHGQVRLELHRALEVWSRHSNLTFREINSDDADILIKFHRREHGDGYSFDGPGRILAHAFFPGEEIGGDAHFDEDETWLLEYEHKDDGDGTRLFMVAVHEFGHSLGLSHSSDPTSLMFPWYHSLNYSFVLPEDDQRGIQTLYGVKDRWAKIPTFKPNHGRSPWKPSYRPAVRPTTTTTSTTSTTTHSPYHRHHHHSPTPPHHSDKPDSCDTSFDAVSVIRRETFFFKGKYMWRLKEEGGVMEGYPALIIYLWKELPKNFTHVDAVYERLDKKIVFFIGREMYLFDGNRLEHGYPKSLESLGLPPEIDHIDAAMVWGHNSKTYFYSGNIYWRFDEDAMHIELDYPREITTMWKGMGSHFDAAFQWKDGKTYFFKGRGFWKLNDIRMKAEKNYPIPSAAFWMGCPNYDLGYPKKPKEGYKKWAKEEKSALSSSSSMITSNFCLIALLLNFLHHLLPR